MAMSTVIGLFDERSHAEQAIARLRGSGFDAADVSLLTHDEKGREEIRRDVEDAQSNTGSEAGDGAAIGAGTGALLGGLGGLLAGVGLLAIPGIGPLLAAGPLVTTLAGAGIGAATGSLLGALTAVGVPDRDAHLYAEAIRRGSSLVSVRVIEEEAERAARILEEAGGVDVDSRRTYMERLGFKTFDESESARAYNPEEIRADREMWANWENRRDEVPLRVGDEVPLSIGDEVPREIGDEVPLRVVDEVRLRETDPMAAVDPNSASELITETLAGRRATIYSGGDIHAPERATAQPTSSRTETGMKTPQDPFMGAQGTVVREADPGGESLR